LALVHDGDIITLDAHKRILQLEVSEEELALRRANWKLTETIQPRGYVHLYQTLVEQARLGADLDLLKGGSGSKVSRDSH
jgi:dihydroxy-acid dehydratase